MRLSAIWMARPWWWSVYPRDTPTLFISEMHSKQWHYSPHRDFQNCYSTRRSLTRFFSSNSSSNTTCAHYTTIQRILHPESNSTCRGQRALRVLLLHTEGKGPSFQKRNSTHRRQGDLLEIHLCVLQDLPMTFQTFQSFMTFQPFQAILQCSSISRESTPFQHSPIRMHILQFDWFPQKTPPSTSWAITDITNIHSSKKGRCCDIGQIDRFSRIELFPLSSCQVIILIARMTFNCFPSCLMS